MPWLNWSLNLHIRLRTISLLISTYNTQVYVQSMPYSFVWLYLIKCVFTCSIFFDSNTKRFLSVFGVFGKYFAFIKTRNFKKQCCPVLATQSRVIQVACHSREITSRFWRLICEWKVQSRGVHKDFSGLARDSLASETSSREKYLANFSNLLAWSVLAGDPGDTNWRLVLVTKNVCFAFQRQFLKNFFSFSLEFLWLFIVFPISLSIETDPNTPQTPFLHHLISRSSRKRYEFSLSCLIFHVSSIIFLIFELSLCFEIYCVWKFFCLD